MVDSPKVQTYDLMPQMSADKISSEVVAAILSGRFDVIIINYANGDMVGHTGDLAAAIEAMQAVDKGVGMVAEAVRKMGGHLLVTADHGNCEQMFDYESGQVHTQHTTYLVPLFMWATSDCRCVRAVAFVMWQ